MKKRNLFKMLTVVCVAGIMLIGCGNSKNTEDTSKKSTVTVTDVKGEVEIPEEPERIVDLSGNSDILSILGYKVIGTATVLDENGNKAEPHGWFIAFAPADDPQIAVAVIVENAGYGGQVAAPVAAAMINVALGR